MISHKSMALAQSLKEDFNRTAQEPSMTEISPPHSQVPALLKARRLQSKITLSQASLELKIRTDYLEAIEENNTERLPEMAYTLGFIRSYANFLGLNGPEVVKMYKADQDLYKTTPPINQVVVQVAERSVPSLWIVIFGIVAFIVAGSYWLGRQTKEEPELLESGVSSSLPVTKELNPQSPSLAPSLDISLPARSRTPALAPFSPLANEGPLQPQQDEGEALKQPEEQKTISVRADHQAPPLAEPLLASSAPKNLQNGPAVLRAQADSWVYLYDTKGRVLVDRVLQAGESVEIQLGHGLFLSTGSLGALAIDAEAGHFLFKGKIGKVQRHICLDPEHLKGWLMESQP